MTDVTSVPTHKGFRAAIHAFFASIFAPIHAVITAILAPIRAVITILLKPVQRALAWIEPRLRHILGFQEGEEFLWWLIRRERSARFQVLIAIPGFLVLFYLAFGKNQIAAIVFILSMALHELGHGFVFGVFGVKWTFRFIFPLGGIAFPVSKKEDKLSNRLPWIDQAWISLGGLLANLILLCLGRIMESTDSWLTIWGKQIVYTNAILIFFNIIPVWKLDATMFFRTVFASLSTENDKKFARVIVVALVFTIILVVSDGLVPTWIGFIISLFNYFGFALFVLSLGVGIWHCQGMDPTYASSAQAMTVQEARNVTIVFMGIAILTAILVFAPLLPSVF